MNGTNAYALSKRYVAKTADTLGSLKGANCTIKKTETVAEGIQVTFEWTGKSGTTETSTIVVPKGTDGAKGADGEKGADGKQGVGVKSLTINASSHLIATLTDGTIIDCGEIPSGGGGGTVKIVKDCDTYWADKSSGSSSDKDTYELSNSGYYESESETYTKYNPSYDTFVNVTKKDDVACLVLAGNYRLPTSDELQTLIDNTTVTKVGTVLHVTDKTTGKYFELPDVKGYKNGSAISGTDYYLLSASKNSDDFTKADVWSISSSLTDNKIISLPRYYGFQVRPVNDEETENTVKVAGINWYKENLGATSSDVTGNYFQFATTDNVTPEIDLGAYIRDNIETSHQLALSANVENKISKLVSVKDNIKYNIFETFAALNKVDFSSYPNGVYVNLVVQDENYPRPDTTYYYSTLYTYVVYRESDDDIKPYSSYDWDLTQVNDEDFDSDLMFVNNLATGKSVSASSGTPTLAVDGKIDSRWESTVQHDPEWIAVDLGAASVVQKIAFCWETASAKDYYIELSMDGENWTRVAYILGSKITGTGFKQITLQHACKARFVRMYGMSRNTDYGYSIYEMGIYGKAAEGSLVFNGKINTDTIGMKQTLATINAKTQSYTSYVKKQEGAGIKDKDTYDKTTVGYYSDSAFTKYNSDDGLTTVVDTDDVSKIVLGSSVRLPTKDELAVFDTAIAESSSVHLYHTTQKFDLHHFGTPTVSRGSITLTFDPSTSIVKFDAVSNSTTDALKTLEIHTSNYQTYSFGDTYTDDDGYKHYYRNIGISDLGENVSFRVLYSLESMSGNEMTAESQSSTDINIYYFDFKGISLPVNGYKNGSITVSTDKLYIMSSTLGSDKTKMNVYTSDGASVLEVNREYGVNVLPVSDSAKDGYTRVGNVWFAPTLLGASNTSSVGVYFQYATTDNADERYSYHAYIYNNTDEKFDEVVLKQNGDVLKEDIVTTRDVGGYKSGTTIPAGTSLETILRTILA